MIELIRSMIREPLLSGIMMFCLLLVGGLVLSDWVEKRRSRNLLKLREAAKQMYRRGQPQADFTAQPPQGKPHRNRPAFRLFRWEVALFAAVVVVVVLPRLKEPLVIQGKAPAQTTGSQPVATSAKPLQQTPVGVPLPVSLIESNTAPFLNHIRLSLSGGEAAQSDSLSLASNGEKLDCSAIFRFDSRTEWDSEGIEREFRENYPVQIGGSSPVEPQSRLPFPKR